MAKKPAAPQIDNAEFLETAEPLTANIAGSHIILEPREFATKSVGFHSGGTMIVTVNGRPIRVQANILLTVIGSKPEKTEAA